MGTRRRWRVGEVVNPESVGDVATWDICSIALCCGGRARAGWLTMLRFYDRHRSEHNSPWTKNGCRVTA